MKPSDVTSKDYRKRLKVDVEVLQTVYEELVNPHISGIPKDVVPRCLKGIACSLNEIANKIEEEEREEK